MFLHTLPLSGMVFSHVAIRLNYCSSHNLFWFNFASFASLLPVYLLFFFLPSFFTLFSLFHSIFFLQRKSADNSSFIWILLYTSIRRSMPLKHVDGDYILNNAFCKAVQNNRWMCEHHPRFWMRGYIRIKRTVSPVWDGLKLVWFNRAFPVAGPLDVFKIS